MKITRAHTLLNIHKGHPWYNQAEFLCGKSKELFNSLNYHKRQTLFDTGEFIDGKQLYQYGKTFNSNNRMLTRASKATG